MSEISIIDRPTRVSDNPAPMPTGNDTSLYDALMALKPPGRSSNAWAVDAGLNRNVFNDIRRNGNASRTTIQKLLGVVGVDVADFERQLSGAGAGGIGASVVTEAAPDPYLAFRGHDRPRDVPVLGTPSCGDFTVSVDGQEKHVETIDMDLDEVIEYVRRPIALDGRKDVYAIYPNGFSMIPKFEPGELQYVESRKPPSIGDYVVVQLKGPDDQAGERVITALLKRLVKQGPDWVELEQFNPPLTFRVERRRIWRIHRILKLEEMVVF
jgi:hypothetical protein